MLRDNAEGKKEVTAKAHSPRAQAKVALPFFFLFRVLHTYPSEGVFWFAQWEVPSAATFYFGGYTTDWLGSRGRWKKRFPNRRSRTLGFARVHYMARRQRHTDLVRLCCFSSAGQYREDSMRATTSNYNYQPQKQYYKNSNQAQKFAPKSQATSQIFNQFCALAIAISAPSKSGFALGKRASAKLGKALSYYSLS